MSQLPDAPKPTTPAQPGEPGLDAAQQSLSDALRVSFGVLKVLMVVLVVVYICSGVFRVDEAHNAVRYRFGEEIGTYGPGWHFGLPFPIEQVVMVPKTTQTLRLDQSFWYDNPDDKQPDELAYEVLDPLKDSFLITGDTNVVHVQFRVNYMIPDEGVERFLRNVGSLERAEALVRTAAERGMIHTIASANIEDIINRSEFNKDKIQAYIQSTLSDLESGISVQQVLIDNNNQSMPNQVREAYNSVTQAQADKVKRIQEARRTYDEKLGRAAGGAHKGLLAMIRAYEAALGSGHDALADLLRTELDRAIRDLRLPDAALLGQISGYRRAVTAAAGSDAPEVLEQARQAKTALEQALSNLPADREYGQRIAGEIAAAISRAKANRSQISTQARLDYERYASALDAYNKTPMVLANDRLQATREKVMTGLTLKVVGRLTRVNTTPDPVDVEAINTAEFDRRKQEAQDEKNREAGN